MVHGPVLELVYMGVMPAWRRRGVGTLLLRRALARCREVGAKEITVVVDVRNTPARRLYERFAFTTVAQREAHLYRWPTA
jgi:ribosomal protein S18 acetylase RimI-like enzyme